MPGYQKKKKEPYDQRTAVLTPEEQKLRAENLAARENFCYDGVKRLSSAICLRAVIEYRRMLRSLASMEQAVKFREDFRMTRDPRGRKSTAPDKFEEKLEELKQDIRDCEDFFNSEMFVACTGLESKEQAIRKIMKLQPEALMTIERRLAKG